MKKFLLFFFLVSTLAASPNIPLSVSPSTGLISPTVVFSFPIVPHGAVGSHEDISVLSGKFQSLTLDQNCTIDTITGFAATGVSTVVLYITNDGAFDFTWPVTVQPTPPINPIAGTVTTVTLESPDNGTHIIARSDFAEEAWPFAIGDETTAVTTGLKLTKRWPYAFKITKVRTEAVTASSSGLPTVNVKDSGTTIFSTKPTIDVGETTSKTAVTAAVISDRDLADDVEVTILVDVAGTDTAGMKVTIYGYRP